MTKQTWMTLILGAATLATVSADDRRYPGDSRGGYDNRGGYNDRDRGRGRYDDRYSSYGSTNGRAGRMDPVNGTLRDLQHVWSRNRVDHHEADHFRAASESLERFRHESSRGRFDRGQLDRAIDHLRNLAQADQIHPRDRNMLRDRLFQLRSYRENGSSWYRN